MTFLITAGPTREPIDPVRYISNRSSGKMGYAIAQAALDAGHEVVLISGPVALAAPQRAKLIRVETADEMYEAVHANLQGIDVAVLCAAVADFKPVACAAHKIKKHDGVPRIELEPTRDILASLGKLNSKNFLLAGFAAETENLEENARKKLAKKSCDVVIGNNVSTPGLGFESNENELTIFLPDQIGRVLPRASKHDLAKELVKILCAMQQNR